ncbi:MAG: phosphatidate cytidylyltransferase, partial [Roseococcus sp.]
HRLMTAGLILQASGLAWLASLQTPTVPYADLVAPFILSGAGMALFYAPVANVVLSSVRPEHEGKASGATNAIRELGGVFGVAVLASVFARAGGYSSAATFAHGTSTAVWVGAGVVALGAVVAYRMAGALSGRWLGFGVAYIGLAGIALLELRHDGAAGRGNVVFLFLVVWASDISAYFTGRFLGGPKLAPAISPNKTWSGSLGGLAGALLVGVAAALALGGGASIAAIAAVALVLGLATQSGDMFESWIKRRFGVKDSSGLLPGHGGLLDRLDGVLAAAPIAALIGLASGPGVHVWRWV